MSALTFNDKLVRIIDGEHTYQEVEAILAQTLLDQGYAKENYPAAIARREENFPTGLYAGDYNVAMPHCDPENVNEGAMCLGVLKSPVTWHRMDDKTQTCDVSLVLMLAITDPKEHLAMLKKVVGLIQDQELVGRIVASDDPAEIYGLTHAKLS